MSHATLPSLILEEVPTLVARAVRESLEENVILLQPDVNERSITNKIAEHLQFAFQKYGFDVDCEYNRGGHYPKKLDLPIDSVMSDETEAKTVYPDIIVHRRGTNQNLVVIEAKKSTNLEGNLDTLKLKQFKQKLGYSFCYRLVFEVGNNGDSTGVSFQLEEVS